MTKIKLGPIHMTLKEVEDLAEDYCGVCIECGNVRNDCEPDARNYDCYDCGKKSVFGMDEAILQSLIFVDEE